MLSEEADANRRAGGSSARGGGITERSAQLQAIPPIRTTRTVHKRECPYTGNTDNAQIMAANTATISRDAIPHTGNRAMHKVWRPARRPCNVLACPYANNRGSAQGIAANTVTVSRAMRSSNQASTRATTGAQLRLPSPASSGPPAGAAMPGRGGQPQLRTHRCPCGGLIGATHSS